MLGRPRSSAGTEALWPPQPEAGGGSRRARPGRPVQYPASAARKALPRKRAAGREAERPSSPPPWCSLGLAPACATPRQGALWPPPPLLSAASLRAALPRCPAAAILGPRRRRRCVFVSLHLLLRAERGAGQAAAAALAAAAGGAARVRAPPWAAGRAAAECLPPRPPGPAPPPSVHERRPRRNMEAVKAFNSEVGAGAGRGGGAPRLLAGGGGFPPHVLVLLLQGWGDEWRSRPGLAGEGCVRDVSPPSWVGLVFCGRRGCVLHFGGGWVSEWSRGGGELVGFPVLCCRPPLPFLLPQPSWPLLPKHIRMPQRTCEHCFIF